MSRQERYRAEYARRRPGWRDCLRVYRALVAANLEPGDAVLDLGCGHAGWLAPELAPAGLSVGLDPDLGALRRDVVERARVVGVAERLPFAEGHFDLVASAFVLEHLERPAEAAAELARVLRPGGRLVLLTPNTWNYNVWLIRLVPNRLHDALARHLYGRGTADTYPVRYRLNTPRRLDRVLGAAGFRRRALVLNGDPTYVSFNGLSFALARGVERVLDRGPLRQARVHLVGVYERVRLAD